MIGSDYYEPCHYPGRVPKIINYKFNFPKDMVGKYGEFDFYIGQGLNCGPGRFTWFIEQNGKRPEKPGPERTEWDAKFKKIWKKMDDDHDFQIKIDSPKNPPLESINPGELPWSKYKGTTEAHNRYFTSALFDSSLPEQKLCGVFHCHNAWFPCAVHISEWYIGDIAGDVYESGQGSNWWGLTPMDKFTVFMMLFVPIFFCIQCCCFCQICSRELSGGIIDEQAVLEDRVMEERERRKGRSRSPRRKRSRSPKKNKRRSPRRSSD